MGLDIPAPVAGIGGGAMVVGGGALAMRARSEILHATSTANFATPKLIVPATRQLHETLDATGNILAGVQKAMDGARVPGSGIFRRIPFIGGAADDLERAARLGAAAHEIAKLDETALLSSAAKLNQRAVELAAAVEGDAARLATAKASVLGGTNKLALGIGVAAFGAALLGAALFDVGGGD